MTFLYIEFIFALLWLSLVVALVVFMIKLAKKLLLALDIWIQKNDPNNKQ